MSRCVEKQVAACFAWELSGLGRALISCLMSLADPQSVRKHAQRPSDCPPDLSASTRQGIIYWDFQTALAFSSLQAKSHLQVAVALCSENGEWRLWTRLEALDEEPAS